jgi:hypothetical protein
MRIWRCTMKGPLLLPSGGITKNIVRCGHRIERFPGAGSIQNSPEEKLFCCSNSGREACIHRWLSAGAAEASDISGVRDALYLIPVFLSRRPSGVGTTDLSHASVVAARISNGWMEPQEHSAGTNGQPPETMCVQKLAVPGGYEIGFALANG